MINAKITKTVKTLNNKKITKKKKQKKHTKKYKFFQKRSHKKTRIINKKNKITRRAKKKTKLKKTLKINKSQKGGRRYDTFKKRIKPETFGKIKKISQTLVIKKLCKLENNYNENDNANNRSDSNNSNTSTSTSTSTSTDSDNTNANNGSDNNNNNSSIKNCIENNNNLLYFEVNGEKKNINTLFNYYEDVKNFKKVMQFKLVPNNITENFNYKNVGDLFKDIYILILYKKKHRKLNILKFIIYMNPHDIRPDHMAHYSLYNFFRKIKKIPKRALQYFDEVKLIPKKYYKEIVDFNRWWVPMIIRPPRV